MISIKRTQPKDYNQMLTEAFAKIPLYSEEWTNFNPSDPAVTILENLSMFNYMQSNEMGQIAEDVRVKLLKLMGFEANPGKCARILLEAENVENSFYLPAGQKFVVGDVNFETNRKCVVNAAKIIDVLSFSDKEYKHWPSLIDEKNSLTVKVFGDNPKEGDELYIFFDKMPVKDKEVIFYFSFDNRFGRVNSEEKKGNDFAEIEWQYYTQDGFEKIKVKDNTRAFLSGGEIRFTLPDKDGSVYEADSTKGYCLKAVLNRADYDVPPRFDFISGFLFEVWQKETQSICHTMPRSDEIEVYCDLLEENYVSVFCKEGRNDDFYHKYEEYHGETPKGRFYLSDRKAFGLYNFSFNRRKFGFGPNSQKDAVKIVAYSEEMMRRYDLGQVLGYDDQEINLPQENIVRESFSVIAEREIEEGEFIYSFVKPGRQKEGSLYYELDDRLGKIIIRDAGEYVGANLYMCSCAVTLGESGNVRPKNIFEPIGYSSDVVFKNPVLGEGGKAKESIRDVERRFVNDIEHPYAAVRGSDYETLVKKIPDLCIKKVKAISDPDKNSVSIVCMPYSDKKNPLLSKNYVDIISSYLEERRILTTELAVIQPVYVPVDVHGTIYVKKHYENCREKIDQILNRFLDYREGSQQFGELLKFDDMFREIEDLECVEYIFELSVYPENIRNTKVIGLDIKPNDNCLLTPGKFYYEINTSTD